MSPYSLELSFTPEQLKVLCAAGGRVAIAKPLKDGLPSLRWLSFRPFEMNVVEWEEQYGIYASLAAPGDGSVTQVCRSDFPAYPGRLYALQPQGCFGPPSAEEGLDPASYYAANSFAGVPAVTLGLFQNAQVNGQERLAGPVSAELIPQAFRARITPNTTVYVWIQSGGEGGAGVSQVTSPPTRVAFADGITSRAFAFDPSTATFMPTVAGARTRGRSDSAGP
jgi:hypothetical protein